jgi:hypothetical protein
MPTNPNHKDVVATQGQKRGPMMTADMIGFMESVVQIITRLCELPGVGFSAVGGNVPFLVKGVDLLAASIYCCVRMS